MTEADLQFVRKISKDAHRTLRHGIQQETPLAQAIIDTAKQEANLKLRLLALLVEAEAMREKAEFEVHGITREINLACGLPSWEEEHLPWSDSDWQKAVREKWGLE